MGKSIVLSFILIAGALMVTGCSKQYDIVIKNGMVYDGSGSAASQTDIGIKDGLIAGIGKIDQTGGATVVNAAGMYISPGFIDMHTHSDRLILDDEGKYARNHLTQGVTTLVTGQCGGGTYDVAEFYAKMEEQGIGANIVHMMGHGTVRRAVMGTENREPTAEELDQMKALVDKGMRGGAAGMSAGLFYVPGIYSQTNEVVELCKVVGQSNGIFAIHLRDESNYNIGLVDAIKEAIEIGEKANVPVQISHIKALGKPVWDKSEEVCTIIEAAQGRGVKVMADQYPYNASSTSMIAATMPSWAQADGKIRERLQDMDLLPRLKREIAGNIDRRGGPETLVISSFSQKREWEGKSLEDVSRILGKNAVDTAIELALMGGPGVVSFNMKDSDLEYFMKKPWVMTGSDGSIQRMGRAKPHPRSYGTFPRKIKHYVNEKNVITIEEMIHKSTALPADMLGLTDRGMIREGMAADIVVFNPNTITDKATFTDPHQYSEGIEYLFVNGKMVINAGAYQEVLAGKPLRK